jgi:hypothetical protein
VRVEDAAGNFSTAKSQTYTFDTTAPITPAFALGTGVSGGATSAEAIQGTGVVTVNAELGSAISVTFTNGAATVTKSLTGTGAAQAVTLLAGDLTTLGNGTISVAASATDVAGNTSALGNSSFTLDTVAPTAAVSTVVFSADTGSSTSDFITKTAAQTITGTLSAATVTGDIVKISLDNGTTWNTATHTIGSTTYSYAGTLTASNTLQVRVEDAAGNFSTAKSQAYTLDNANPTVSTFSPTDNQSGVSKSGDIVITFAENIDLGTGSITIRADSSGGSTFEAYDVAKNPSNLSISGATLTINPSNTLSSTTTYYVVISSTAITDIAGNAYAGTSSYNFATPIVLDLNGDGVQYVDRSAGVTYDYAGNGIQQATAWVNPNDGILALQNPDSSLRIVFGVDGGTDLQGLAKMFDSNYDGVLDAQDASFSQFGVWKDSNSDGIVANGEFTTLGAYNIISLSLGSTGDIHSVANGDVTVYGETIYTTSDGFFHTAHDAGFATGDGIYSFTTNPDPVVVNGQIGQDTFEIAALIGAPEQINNFNINEGDHLNLSPVLSADTQLTGQINLNTALPAQNNSTVSLTLGGVTYEIAAIQNTELTLPDLMANPVSGVDFNSSLHGSSWTEIVDITSSYGGPASITANDASQLLNDNYSNANGGDWTLAIKSGNAIVDSANKQVVFSSNSSANEVVITTADGTTHDITNVDKINWHG